MTKQKNLSNRIILILIIGATLLLLIKNKIMPSFSVETFLQNNWFMVANGLTIASSLIFTISSLSYNYHQKLNIQKFIVSTIKNSIITLLSYSIAFTLFGNFNIIFSLAVILFNAMNFITAIAYLEKEHIKVKQLKTITTNFIFQSLICSCGVFIISSGIIGASSNIDVSSEAFNNFINSHWLQFFEIFMTISQIAYSLLNLYGIYDIIHNNNTKKSKH